MEKVVHLLSRASIPRRGLLARQVGLRAHLPHGRRRPYATDVTKNTAIAHARKIAAFAERPLRMFVAPTGPIYKAMQATWSEPELKYTCIFCKRMLYRVAREVAIRENAQAISTGEIIGEQASQTIDNLALIQQAVGSFLVVRPLLTWDKLDVMKLAARSHARHLEQRQGPVQGGAEIPNHARQDRDLRGHRGEDRHPGAAQGDRGGACKR